jgi:hypothetical protein
MGNSRTANPRQTGFVIWLAAIPVLLIVLLLLYTWFVLSWSYSEGDRAGYIQKFSKKGWLCKTWEGELAMVTMPGTLTEKFYFTVRDDAVAEKLNKHLGKKVSLTYSEHIGIPSSCFGDTGYFVTDIADIEH